MELAFVMRIPIALIQSVASLVHALTDTFMMT